MAEVFDFPRGGAPDRALFAQGPQNAEVERGLIGAMLMNAATASALLGRVEPKHFAEPVHQQIYAVLADMLAAKRPITAAVMKTYLPQGDVAPGVPLFRYIGDCIADACTGVNVVPFADEVLDLYARRELVRVGREIVDNACDPAVGQRCAGMLDAAEAGLADVRTSVVERSVTTGPAGASARRLMTVVREMALGTVQAPGTPTGIGAIDRITGGLQSGDLWIIGGRPGQGKSITGTTIARGVAQSAEARHAVDPSVRRNAALFFSFELNEQQVTARLLSDLAYLRSSPFQKAIGYGDIIKGRVTDPDQLWRLDNAMARLEALPLSLDWSSRLTVPQIASRVRSHKARMARLDCDVRVVVLDYLKMIQASDRYRGQRHQEVAEISYALKQMAKDEGVAVVLLAQLNRQNEMRSDPRPMLSDLKECVVGSTNVIDAATGHLVSVRDLMPGQSIVAMSARQKLQAFTVENVWSTGNKEVFRLTTRTGRRVTASANHPFMTATGWRRLDSLKVGDVVAGALRVDLGVTRASEPDDLCRFLGYMVGDGTYLKSGCVGFISSDPDTFADCTAIVTERFPDLRHRLVERENCREAYFVATNSAGHGAPYRNGLRNWLREIGVWGSRDCDKRAPACVFESLASTKEFLAGYLSADGCVKVARKGKRLAVWEVHFDSVCRELLDDVQHLLSRVGVVGTINSGYTSSKGTRPIYRLSVAPDAGNLAQFAACVVPRGRKGVLLARMIEELPEQVTSASILTLPSEISSLMGAKHPYRVLGSRHGPKTVSGWKVQGKRPRRDSCAALAALLDDDELRVWAEGDLTWEAVTSIESIGIEETFDLSVPGAANFLANGLVVHNSGDLEADADVVAFVHRPEYYIRQSKAFNDGNAEAIDKLEAARGKMEMIVAKNRAGVTATLDLFCDVGSSMIDDRDRRQVSKSGNYVPDETTDL